MKTYATILLLSAVLFVKFTSSAADALRASPSPLELVFVEDRVLLSRYGNITNTPIEVIFRNVGENWMEPNDLPLGLSIVWDGKAYKLAHPEKFFVSDGPPFGPMMGWRRGFLLSDFVIPPEGLKPGRHAVAVRDEFSEANTFAFSTTNTAVFSTSNKQIFAESSTLTVFIVTP